MPPMMGMGMPPQVRPPPPDYPFPPRAAPPQPPLGSVSGTSTSSTGSTYFGHDPKENGTLFTAISVYFSFTDKCKYIYTSPKDWLLAVLK